MRPAATHLDEIRGPSRECLHPHASIRRRACEHLLYNLLRNEIVNRSCQRVPSSAKSSSIRSARARSSRTGLLSGTPSTWEKIWA
jgi:hypothetical protein